MEKLIDKINDSDIIKELNEIEDQLVATRETCDEGIRKIDNIKDLFKSYLIKRDKFLSELSNFKDKTVFIKVIYHQECYYLIKAKFKGTKISEEYPDLILMIFEDYTEIDYDQEYGYNESHVSSKAEISFDETNEYQIVDEDIFKNALENYRSKLVDEAIFKNALENYRSELK